MGCTAEQTWDSDGLWPRTLLRQSSHKQCMCDSGHPVHPHESSRDLDWTRAYKLEIFLQWSSLAGEGPRHWKLRDYQSCSQQLHKAGSLRHRWRDEDSRQGWRRIPLYLICAPQWYAIRAWRPPSWAHLSRRVLRRDLASFGAWVDLAANSKLRQQWNQI